MKALTKKIVVLLMVFVIAAMAVVPTMAATASTKEDVIATGEQCIPSAYKDMYYNSLKGILDKVPCSSAQADQLIATLNATKSQITDKGHSLHQYTEAERAIMIDCFKSCCNILNLTYSVKLRSSDATNHKADEYVEVYYNGELVGTLDGDVARKTDVDSNNSTMTILFVSACAALILAVAAYVVSKKFIKAK